MKRFLLVSLSAFVGAVLAVVLLGLPLTVRAGGGGVEKCAAKNGDVNADGAVNLSDAVTILGHLFLGSPTELVPLCETQAPSAGLPDTGQTKCYDQTGAEIPCDGATCSGQDGLYRAGCPSEGRFVDNGNNTVTDNCTGLMWQKDTADVNGDGQSTNQDSAVWCDALTYCENLSFASHDDWRLPNLPELESIVEYFRVGPSIDPVFGAFSAYYWSSTSNAGVPSYAWSIVFTGGIVISHDKDNDFYVRAVRNAS